MASIQSLLNPLPELDRHSLPTPSVTSSTSTVALRAHRHKKQKIAKDAPIFNRGKIRGELRYHPCEERDEELTKLHREFRLHPMGDIAAYPRHIPYNSDKKSFQERTGRESFEVFQYTFEIPGEEKQWTVMWDYNIGLVRTTHLFKCNDYSKTTPAKMLNANPGLRDICHSITGGALAAQGYWMPFEAAKAVAATFCWKIRHALTPLFGLEFPSLCIPPSDRSRYGRMVIDPSIVRKATETAHLYRVLEIRSPPPNTLRVGCRPSSARDNNALGKHLLPKSHHHHDLFSDRLAGYGSSPEYNTDAYCVSPVSPIRNTFTPVNPPRSTDTLCSSIPSPQHVLASLAAISNANAMDVSDVDPETGSDESSSSTLYSESSVATDCPSSDLDEDYRDSDADVESRAGNAPMKTKGKGKIQPTSTSGPRIETRSRKHSSALFACEVKAAHALLSLYMQDAIGSDNDDSYEPFGWKGRKRRRAST
ncbi:hypothetical protein P175DRAFT_0464515 [Aspergillus ochraceoroseus IBT 24754]|uniref:HTH APSES-type domain-containing protein n=2 Tax=Aspergillus ochraceoroseus TaxID=138278 RepID=A0A2T5LP29_9EURO|nr:uncharacterized protein P175DRAFT_0464515 [Aspergillus ochraceoroseus IBT 24754]KKK19409.1 hypothetical protein AOCH_001328 [Aspergillus ochraceoroseus]PTU18043.1 hypothetical protein P175DRAFT_0464515 [Aspergillus ochraceoroseus IBT 24754]